MGNHFRVNFGVVQRAAGGNACKRSAYQGCNRVRDEHSGQTFDFSRKADEHRGHMLLLPDDAPAWTADPQQLWSKAEAAERRGDAQTARTVDLSIPREIPAALHRDFARAMFQPLADQGMTVQLDIHSPPAIDGEQNPHVHALLTMRELDGDRFSAKKNREWNQAFTQDRGRAMRAAFEARIHEFCRSHQIEWNGSARRNDERGLAPPEPQLPRAEIEIRKRQGLREAGQRRAAARDEYRKVERYRRAWFSEAAKLAHRQVQQRRQELRQELRNLKFDRPTDWRAIIQRPDQEPVGRAHRDVKEARQNLQDHLDRPAFARLSLAWHRRKADLKTRVEQAQERLAVAESVYRLESYRAETNSKATASQNETLNYRDAARKPEARAELARLDEVAAALLIGDRQAQDAAARRGLAEAAVAAWVVRPLEDPALFSGGADASSGDGCPDSPGDDPTARMLARWAASYVSNQSRARGPSGGRAGGAWYARSGGYAALPPDDQDAARRSHAQWCRRLSTGTPPPSLERYVQASQQARQRVEQASRQQELAGHKDEQARQASQPRAAPAPCPRAMR